MKRFALFSLSILSSLFLFSQNNPVFEGPEIDVGYNGAGAIKGSAGIIGDYYYVVENDYGRALDFNNNIRTSLAILSLKNGNLVKRITLNDLATAGSGQKIDKVLFCSVFTWKDKILGIYTFKKPNGTEFEAYAIVLDREGRLETPAQNIGSFTHQLLREYLPGQMAGHTGGRNTLSVVNDFKFCMTPDSLHLVVQCTPENNQSNLRFKIYSPAMALEKDVSVLIPIQGKEETISQFIMDNAGIIYLVTLGGRYSLRTINTARNNELVSREFTVAGKNIGPASIGFTEKGTPIVAGVYHDNSKSGGMHGAFAFKADLSATQFAISTKDLPDSVVEELAGKKAVKKGEGLFEFINFIRFVPKAGGGLYAFGESNSTSTVMRGTTGALNTYYEETWLHGAYSISEEGKILWESVTGAQVMNRELATRCSRIEWAPVGEAVHGLIILPKPNGVHDYHGTAAGTSEISLGGSKQIMDYPFVEATIRPIGGDNFAVIGFNEGRNPKMRLVKVHF